MGIVGNQWLRRHGRETTVYKTAPEVNKRYTKLGGTRAVVTARRVATRQSSSAHEPNAGTGLLPASPRLAVAMTKGGSGGISRPAASMRGAERRGILEKTVPIRLRQRPTTYRVAAHILFTAEISQEETIT